MTRLSPSVILLSALVISSCESLEQNELPESNQANLAQVATVDQGELGF